MVTTSPRRKIEILVDAPLLRRLRDMAAEAGVSGYTLQPTIGGDGDMGRWLDDQVTGGAGSKVLFVTILSEEAASQLLTAVEPLLDEYGLIVTSSVVEVIRGDRF